MTPTFPLSTPRLLIILIVALICMAMLAGCPPGDCEQVVDPDLVGSIYEAPPADTPAGTVQIFPHISDGSWHADTPGTLNWQAGPVSSYEILRIPLDAGGEPLLLTYQGTAPLTVRQAVDPFGYEFDVFPGEQYLISPRDALVLLPGPSIADGDTIEAISLTRATCTLIDILIGLLS